MQWVQKQKGFTIVELLIVVVVIAILAAITIVAYNGIQNRAKESAAQSAASQAAKKVATYAITNTDTFPVDKAAFLAATGLKEDGSTTYQYVASSNQTSYCLTTTTGSISFYTTNTNQSPVKGGCPGHGQNGAPAITNLAVDPTATNYTIPGGQYGWRTGRWFGSSGAAGSYSLVTGASDGPAGISTYARKTWSTAPPAIGNSGDTGFETSSSISRPVVTAGQTYTFSCYLRPSVNRVFHMSVYQYTTGGAAHATPRIYGASINGPANQWTRVSHTYVVPSGVESVALACDSNTSTTGGAVNWNVGSTLDGTGLMVTEGSTLYTYADGNSSNWIWNGTQNNSSSTGPAS